MAEKIKRANRKFIRATAEEKKRFKMCKSGKFWVIAGMTMMFFGSSQVALQGTDVKADEANSGVKNGSSTLNPASDTSQTIKVMKSSATASTATSTAQNSSAVTPSVTMATSSASSSASTASSKQLTLTSSAPKVEDGLSSSSGSSQKTTSAPVKQATSSSDTNLSVKFNLGNIATIRQVDDRLVLTMAANQNLTKLQYEAIVEYAGKRGLRIHGLNQKNDVRYEDAGSNHTSYTYIDRNGNQVGEKKTLVEESKDSNKPINISVPENYVLDLEAMHAEYGNAGSFTYNEATKNVSFSQIKGIENFKIFLDHETKTYIPSDESDAFYAETHRTVTEHIEYWFMTKKAAPDYDDYNSFERSITIDLVTNKVIEGEQAYGEWSLYDGDGKFEEVTSPTVLGYYPDTPSVAGTDVTADTKNIKKNITYRANQDEEIDIFYVNTKSPDYDPAHPENSIVKVDQYYNSTGSEHIYDVEAPKGYIIDLEATFGYEANQDAKFFNDFTELKGSVKIEIKGDESDNVFIFLTQNTRTIKPTDPEADEEGDRYFEDTNVIITEEVTYNIPGQDPSTKYNDVHYGRTIEVDPLGNPVKDEQGNYINASKWGLLSPNAQLDAVVADNIEGYHISITVDGVKIDGTRVEEKTVNIGDSGRKIVINYIPNEKYDATVHFIDQDKNDNESNPADVKTDEGFVGETGSYTYHVSDGYVVDEATTIQNLPEGYTITPTKDQNGVITDFTITFTYAQDHTDDFTIYLKHGIKLINPDDADADNDKYYDDTHVVITENIDYQKDGQPDGDRQTNSVEYHRTIEVDAVNGNVIPGSESDWKLVTADGGDNKLNGVTPDPNKYPGYDMVITVDGKEISGDSVEAITVGPNGKDRSIVVNYVQNEAVDATVHFVDQDQDHPQTIPDEKTNTFVAGTEGTYTYTIKGGYVFDEKTTIDGLPAGAKLVTSTDKDGNTVVTVTFIATEDNTDDFTIFLYHGTTVIDPKDSNNPDPTDPDSPNNPDNQYYDDVHATVNQEVHYENEDADGQPAIEDYHDSRDFTRTITVDAVTGDVIPDSETAWRPETDTTFPGKDIAIPDRPGYHAEITVNGASKTSIEDMVADPNTGNYDVVITYVANDEVKINGKVVDDDDADGDKGEFPKVLEIADGLDGKTGSVTFEIPDNYKYDASNPANFEHGNATIEVSEDGKTLTVTFTYTSDGKGDFTIHLQHKTHVVDPDDPDDPDNPDRPDTPGDDYYEDTHNIYTETVTYKDKDGKEVGASTTNSVEYHRTIVVDDVTGLPIDDQAGAWTLKSDDNMLNGVTDAAIKDFSDKYPGYHAEITINGQPAPSNEKVDPSKQEAEKGADRTIVIQAVANEATTATIKTVDDDPDHPQSFDDIKTEKGLAGAGGIYTYDIPDNYVYENTDFGTDGNGKVELIEDDKGNVTGVTLTFTYDAGNTDNFTIHLSHQKKQVDPSDPDANRTITQNVTYETSDGSTPPALPDNASQTKNFHRDGTLDLVTGDIAWDAWVPEEGGNFQFENVAANPDPGYYPNVDHAAGATLTQDIITNYKDGQLDQTILYTPTDGTTVVGNYIDSDRNDAKIGGDIRVESGVTNAEGTYTIDENDLPAGYELDEKRMKDEYGKDGDMWSLSEDGKTITFTYKADDSDNFKIYLKHKIKDVIADDTTDPAKEHHTTVDETIHYWYGEKGGKPAADDHTDSLYFYQKGTYDEVDQVYTWSGEWINDQGDSQFDEVPSPKIAGYTPSEPSIPLQKVDGDSTDIEKDVIYTAQDATAKVHYMDEDAVDKDGKDLPDQEIFTDDATKNPSLKGKTDADGSYKIDLSNVKDGYVVDVKRMQSQYPGMTFTEKDGTITFTFAAENGATSNMDDIFIYLKHDHKTIDSTNPDANEEGDSYYDATHDVHHEEVMVVDPKSGKINDLSNDVEYDRSIEVDAVTGEPIVDDKGKLVDPGEWKLASEDDKLNGVTDANVADILSKYPGCHVQITVDGKEINESSVDALAVKAEDGVKRTIEVKVVPNDGAETRIHYVDDKGNEIWSPNPITGVVGEEGHYTIDMGNAALKGWVIDTAANDYKNDQAITFTFAEGNGDDITIVIKHGTHIVDPTNLDADNAGDKYYNDTHIVITENVDYQQNGQPDGNRQSNSVEYNRSVEVDSVTGDVIENSKNNSEWEVATVDGRDDKLDGVDPDPDKYPGYHVEIMVDGKRIDTDRVTTLKVGPNDKGRNIVVNYVANDNIETEVTYYDNDDHKIVSGPTKLESGTIDEQGTYKYTVPENYVLDEPAMNDEYGSRWNEKGDTVTFTYLEGDTDNFTIYLRHKVTSVDSDANNANADVTLHVDYTTSDGADVAPDSPADQVLHFHRTGTYDEVTKTYDWNEWIADDGAQFDDVVSPSVAGYHPNLDSVKDVTIDLSTFTDEDQFITKTIIYSPDDHTDTHVTFVDGDENDAQVGESCDVTPDGKTNTKGFYTVDNVPDGYVIDTDRMREFYDEEGDDWSLSADGKTITFVRRFGDSDDFQIFLQHGTTPVNHDNPNWPDNSKAVDLEKDVTRTIDYKDAATGATIAESVTQAVSYERTAIVDTVTGEILGYDTNGDGAIDTEDGEKAWIMSEDSAAKLWDAVNSPDLSGKGYDAPSQATVEEVKVDSSMESTMVTVTYSHSTDVIDSDESDDDDLNSGATEIVRNHDDDNDINSVSTKVSGRNHQTDKPKAGGLPQTDEAIDAGVLGVLGLVLAGSLGLGKLVKRRKNGD